MSDFQQRQQALTAYLRDPVGQPAPEQVEHRRLAVYEELVYKNIEGFLSSGFPVCRSILSDAQWHDLVRDFIRDHACQSPYFLQISEEFLRYLAEQRPAGREPAFFQALAHYEWVELALDTAEHRLPARGATPPLAFLDVPLQRSVLAWPLSYPYPVHRISADYQPGEADDEQTHIVVYRDRGDRVGFMEVNSLTSHLLLMFEKAGRARDYLTALAIEQGLEAEHLLGFAESLLEQLYEADILDLAAPI